MVFCIEDFFLVYTQVFHHKYVLYHVLIGDGYNDAPDHQFLQILNNDVERNPRPMANSKLARRSEIFVSVNPQYTHKI